MKWFKMFFRRLAVLILGYLEFEDTPKNKNHVEIGKKSIIIHQETIEHLNVYLDNDSNDDENDDKDV